MRNPQTRSRTFAVLGGLLGAVAAVIAAMGRLDFSNAEERQEGLGSILGGLMIGALLGYFLGKGTKDEKRPSAFRQGIRLASRILGGSRKSERVVKDPCREMTIRDGIIIVAALAIALAWTRGTAQEILQRSTTGPFRGMRLSGIMLLMWWTPIPIPSLVTATLAVLAMRLRRPRPPWRRLVRQPGALACLGIALVLAIQTACLVVALGIRRVPGIVYGGPNLVTTSHWALLQSLVDSGLVILGGWIVLMGGRLWKPEASWLDRAGRFLGVCWIALFLTLRMAIFLISV